MHVNATEAFKGEQSMNHFFGVGRYRYYLIP